ncbi:hypothetical protein [Salinimicrobium sp. TH3]|uniref:hypothetical protein n=1 Tax=Salinimicrobium sp. TH3 TaxID=2997342 RepID=UPI002275C2E0|nr:hypothetical protein [Salinimicrobium sp. TH3]MCY2687557.1 hypothetical protein [Salinimicrobium sp. TH3]
MKRLSSLIAFSSLLHLLIVDITFFLTASKAIEITLALILYNLVWLGMTINIVHHTYSKK